MSKSQRETLVTRVSGYVSQIRSLQPFSVGGVPCSKTNREIFSRCLEAWLFLIEDLMLRFHLCEDGRRARMENFAQAIFSTLTASTDLAEVLALLDELYESLVSDRIDSIETFKQFQLDHSYEGLDYSRLLSPINHFIFSALTTESLVEKAHCLRSVGQFLRFPRKLVFQDIGLEDKALEDYLATEVSLQAAFDDLGDKVGNESRDSEMPEGITDDRDHTFDQLSLIVKDWFEDFHLDLLKPNHGSGSVAEGSLTLSQKFHVMKVDKTIKILLSTPCEPERWREFFPLQPGDGLVRCSRTIFVPKTAVKLRTISMEPTTLQYLQQGVMRELYRFIERHPYLGVRVRLADQTQNQVLALEGSLRRTYGTIDLSKASDTVSWYLVKRVFRAVPHLYRWLLGTRSSCTILPTGERLQLKKYAPMGSALCFPVECIIFSAIVELASRNVCKRLRIPKRVWSVYGDDLVVQSECYEETIRLLALCGFTVNTSKSYNNGPYRESCGKEYYAGVDITALYYRIPFYDRKVTPSAYGSLCSAANNAFLHSLPLYRWYLITKVLSVLPGKVPFFSDSPMESPYIYSPEPTNHRAVVRWSHRYQREEGRFIVTKSKPRDGEFTDDTLAYFCKLVDMAWRSSTAKAIYDEPPSPYAMHGCVEFFSSTVLPIVPRHTVDKTIAWDWWDT